MKGQLRRAFASCAAGVVPVVSNQAFVGLLWYLTGEQGQEIEGVEFLRLAVSREVILDSQSLRDCANYVTLRSTFEYLGVQMLGKHHGTLGLA